MKKTFAALIKSALACLLCGCLVLSLAGCGDDPIRAVPLYSDRIKTTSVADGIVAENDRFEMRWEAENFRVSVTDKTTGKVWSTLSENFVQTGEGGTRAKVMLGSPFMLQYITQPNNRVNTYYGYNIRSDGRVSAKAIDGGIRVIYFVDTAQIAVPFLYKLEDDHFTVTVDTNGILEGEFPLYRVEVAPFMVSAKNGAGSYLTVPSGSGALMYTDTRNGAAREYCEPVYGEDFANTRDTILEETYGASMPVFAVSDTDGGLVGIIESGADNCYISATAGDETIGYSAAYASFAVRGKNTDLVTKRYGAVNRVINYSDGLTLSKCTVGYYPLAAGNCDYNAVAKCYRDYLIGKGMKEGVKNDPLFLQMIGGVQVDRTFLGVSYTSLQAATTVGEAEKIASDVAEKTGMQPVLQLKGFGTAGNDIGKIGGGFKVGGVLGDFGDVQNLQQKFKDTFFDFDVVRFTSSGNGFSFASNAAKAENKAAAGQYLKYGVSQRNGEKDDGKYRLLQRAKLTDAVEKAVETAKKQKLKNLSFSTLGVIAYSDYRTQKYTNKGKMETDVSKMLKSAGKSVGVMTQGANAYAAAVSDKVIAAPSKSSRYNVLDADIPLYQMVFRGCVSLSGESVNLSGDPVRQFLETVKTGSGLLYTVTDHYDGRFLIHDSALAGSVYGDLSETLTRDCKAARAFLEAVADSAIESYKIVANGVSETTFRNGITVAVNETDAPVETSLGTVEAQSFVYE